MYRRLKIIDCDKHKISLHIVLLKIVLFSALEQDSIKSKTSHQRQISLKLINWLKFFHQCMILVHVFSMVKWETYSLILIQMEYGWGHVVYYRIIDAWVDQAMVRECDDNCVIMRWRWRSGAIKWRNCATMR